MLFLICVNDQVNPPFLLLSKTKLIKKTYMLLMLHTIFSFYKIVSNNINMLSLITRLYLYIMNGMTQW